MWRATGKNLVESFKNVRQNSPLIVYSEDIVGDDVQKLDLTILRDFREKNKAVIPKIFGGEHDGRCGCRKMKRGQIDHEKGCVCSLWNRNMYRWFHKIVAMQQAAQSFTDTNYLVWLDSDCYLKKNIPDGKIEELAHKYDLVYMLGKARIAVETGIIIFNVKEGMAGRGVIGQWFQRYTRGLFRKDFRWDDSYQMIKVIELGIFKTFDMCAAHAVSAPALVSPLAEYIGHNKGTHVRDHRMF